jgi:cell division protein YceG involved in septum cleavage
MYWAILLIFVTIVIFALIRATTVTWADMAHYTSYAPKPPQIAKSDPTVKIKTPDEVTETIHKVADEMDYDAPRWLTRLAFCESSLNPQAKNKSGARGLFQIMPSHKDVSDDCAFDVECSTRWTIKQLTNGHASWWVCNDIIS